MSWLKENSTGYLTVEFLNSAGVAEAPSSATYRVDTEDGKKIRGETVISSPDSSETITLTPSDNVILHGGQGDEEHRVSVRAVYGADDVDHQHYTYTVRHERYSYKS